MIFKALLFEGTKGSQGQTIDIEASQEGLAFQMGERKIQLVYSLLHAEIGGLERNQLIIKAQDYTFFVSDMSILEPLLLTVSSRFKQDLEQIYRQWTLKRRRRLPTILVTIIAVALFLLAIYQGFFWSRDFLVSRIPVSWEEKMGEVALKDAVSTRQIYQNPQVVDPVLAIGKQLTSALEDSPYHFHFQVVYSPTVNAFALPGGEMVVFTGLLQEAQTPEEVAGVMAHEIQHVLQRHGLKRIIGRMGIFSAAGLLFGDAAGLVSIMAEAGTQLLALKFDREQETIADRQGALLMHKAGINPHGMLHFFRRMAEKESQLQETLAFATTHPASHQRVEYLKELVRPYPSESYQTLDVNWKAIQAELDK